jgi:protoporphyrinogen oxidase
VAPLRILILGAGPTGLGAAVRLREMGHDEFLVVDQATQPGGLARSVRDENGFLWDLGGHVLEWRYRPFRRLLSALPIEWLTTDRHAYIRVADRWVPYPIQYHLSHLPPQLRASCVAELTRVVGQEDTRPSTFGHWLHATFGSALAELFMVPYNSKVWGLPPEDLDAVWVEKRVPRIPPEQLISPDEDSVDRSWGPRAVKYPSHGGTGAIWQQVGRLVGLDRFRFGRRAMTIDAEERTVAFDDGSSEPYDALISSVPLDRLIGMTPGAPLAQARARFRRTSTRLIGLGLEAPSDEPSKSWTWIYSADRGVPFYRITNFGAYSPDHVPDPSRHRSFLAECSVTPGSASQPERQIAETLAALRAFGLIGPRLRVVSEWCCTLDHGYPTPFVGREQVLGEVQKWYEARNVFSRGRFGGWKFEVSDQDQSFSQGVEVVDRLLSGSAESIYQWQA